MSFLNYSRAIMLHTVLLAYLLCMSTLTCSASVPCCSGKGGVSACDYSSGYYFCINGDYSTCYCTKHAMMDLQEVSGCCLWQGGVLQVDPLGLVICNSGSVSEVCSL